MNVIRPCTVELLASAATELRIMALIDDGGANWGCYGPSLVPVLPQAPGGAQHPQPLLRYGPVSEV